MTSTEGAREDQNQPNQDQNQQDEDQERQDRSGAAYDAAWAVEDVVDELREVYAELALNLERARVVTVGSAHPLPARALRHWGAARELADRAARWLAGGVGELARVPGVAPLGSAGDLVTALDVAVDGVLRRTLSVIELRARVGTATGMLTENVDGGEPDPAVVAALLRWREGAGALDELTARMQCGGAALSAYANGVFGVDPAPGRVERAAVLAQATRYPPDSVGVGAELAGRLLCRAGYRESEPPVPAHLRVPLRRRVVWQVGRGFFASGGRRIFRRRAEAAFFDDCLRAMLLLTRGNTIWYADRVDLFRRAGVLDGYADALTAAVVLAVDRRLVPGRDGVTVRHLAGRLHRRYDDGTGEVSVDAVERLIGAALGGDGLPAVDPVGLTVLQSLLLVDLLGDERPSGGDLAVFRGEAVGLALAVGPARLAAAGVWPAGGGAAGGTGDSVDGAGSRPGPRAPDRTGAGGERSCDG